MIGYVVELSKIKFNVGQCFDEISNHNLNATPSFGPLPFLLSPLCFRLPKRSFADYGEVVNAKKYNNRRVPEPWTMTTRGLR